MLYSLDGVSMVTNLLPQGRPTHPTLPLLGGRVSVGRLGYGSYPFIPRAMNKWVFCSSFL